MRRDGSEERGVEQKYRKRGGQSIFHEK